MFCHSESSQIYCTVQNCYGGNGYKPKSNKPNLHNVFLSERLIQLESKPQIMCTFQINRIQSEWQHQLSNKENQPVVMT